MQDIFTKKLDRRSFNKVLTSLGLGFAAFPLLHRSARAAQEIHYHTWSGYDVPELMGGYLEKYGGPPEFSYIATDDESFAKIRSGFTPDLMHPGNYSIRRLADSGLVQPLDTSRLKNWPHIAEGVKDMKDSVIDGKRYYIPSEFGNSSVLYRTDLVDPKYNEENSWQIMYDEKYSRKLAWYDDAGATVEIAGLVLGYDNIFTLNDEQLEEVGKLISKQRDITRFYWNDVTEIEQALASGEVVAAYGWNQSLVSLKQQGISVGLMTPKEGIFAWSGGFVMHKDCKNEDAAYDFIDSWVSAESGAWLIENYGYGSTNLKAYELVASERLDELGFSDPEGMLSDTIFFPALDPEIEKKYQDLYQQVRAAG
ncbi:MAG: extracellular solute-binding protein [Gammaproteobacteria bacterium]|nr:extracellular solute-binding protein [Gammaproteobacteria bacterium]